MNINKLRLIKVKSLKKGFFSRLWKRGKIAHLTDEELNEIIQLLETGDFDKSLYLIRKINRRNLDIDGKIITSAFKNIILHHKVELEEDDILLSMDEEKKLEKQAKTLRGKIVANLMYTIVGVYYKREENHLKSLNKQLETIKKSQTDIDSYQRDWFLMNTNAALGTSILDCEYDSALKYFSEASKINDKHNWK